MLRLCHLACCLREHAHGARLQLLGQCFRNTRGQTGLNTAFGITFPFGFSAAYAPRRGHPKSAFRPFLMYEFAYLRRQLTMKKAKHKHTRSEMPSSLTAPLHSKVSPDVTSAGYALGRRAGGTERPHIKRLVLVWRCFQHFGYWIKDTDPQSSLFSDLVPAFEPIQSQFILACFIEV